MIDLLSFDNNRAVFIIIPYRGADFNGPFDFFGPKVIKMFLTKLIK